jgi:5,10-methylenetetrahydrofolate reductase
LLPSLSAGRTSITLQSKILTAFKNSGGKDIPQEFDFVGITSPQSPGGVANIEPADVHRHIVSKNLLGELDFIPHLSCKDANADAIVSLLAAHRAAGVESVLALTGDKPVSAKGVFELESTSLLAKITRINNEAYLSAKIENLAETKQFFAGAAVSPFNIPKHRKCSSILRWRKKSPAERNF